VNLPILSRYHHVPQTTNIDHTSAPKSITTMFTLDSGLFAVAALTLPSLVLPNFLSIPVCPFEVASTAGSTVTVLWVRVFAVVGNVWLGPPAVSVNAEDERNTSAAAGAGTVTVQTVSPDPFTEHEIVWMSSVPDILPSDSKLLPNVWPAHVKLPF
jgi:hypothetical protein